MTVYAMNNGFGSRQEGRLEIPIATLATGGVAPAAVAVDQFRGYAYTINDNSDFQFVVPRDWMVGTTISLVIQWACNENYAANNGEVNWQMDWESVANDGTQVVGTGTVGNTTSGDVNVPTTARQLTSTTIGAITAANLDVDDLVRMIITRIALVGGANPVQEPEIYACYLEYTRNAPQYDR